MRDKFAQRIKKVLVKHGVLDVAKAEEAIASADRSDSASFADFLLERQIMDETSLLSALAQEVGICPVDLDRVDFENEALMSLTYELATYYCVLPIARVGGVLTIAVGNPFDILKLDDVRILTNCDLRTVVSTERAIRRNIARAYAGVGGNGEGKGDGESVTSAPAESATAESVAAAAEAAIRQLEAESEADVDMEIKQEVEEIVDLSKAQAEASGSPVIKIINNLVIRALSQRASDIHIEPFEKTVRVRLRLDGILREIASPPRTLLNSMVSRIKIMSNLDIAERRIPQDGKFQVKFEGRQVDFRVSILPTIHGEKAVLRVLDSSSLNMGISQLGFEKEAENAFRRALAASYGMLLVTGPTGSGKSTTLYASLREVLDPEENVCTVEDPVEYQLEGVIQVPVNVKRGLTFASALRSLLRQDPDTIMIGEIRDFETADIAVKAAITGHLVFSTLHTNDAASSITRLVDMGIDPFMVSSSTILIAAQRLMRKLCDKCKAPTDVMPEKKLALKMGFKEEDFSNWQLFKRVGCNACTGGYRGRFAVLEALEINDDIRRLVIEGRSSMDMKRCAFEHGMLTLRRTGLLNAMRGRTTLEEVLRMTMAD
ncbi:MAG: Flp pilus assembly complex ATPase component TadA [Planctomycetes bacterium]|nr:Flp pilus assembly complex ATPase component TadA [Planctomycetota bacterium]